MAYNIDLEERIDQLASRVGGLVKKKMFGGVGYMLNGNLCFGIHKNDLILRAAPETCEELLKNDEVQPFDITGKPMKGWLLVSLDAVETDSQLLKMLGVGVNFANTLSRK